MFRLPVFFGTATLCLALLVRVGSAQDAKKEGDKVIKGSIPAGWNALKLSEDQAAKIRQIDFEYKTKIAELDRKIESLHRQSRTEMAKQLTEDQKALLARLHEAEGSRALTLLQQLTVEEYALVKRELFGLDSQIRRTNTLLTLQRAELKKAMETEKVPAELVEEYVAKHAQVQAEQAAIANLERKIQEFRKLVDVASPRLREFERELNEAQARLQKIKSRVQPEALQEIRTSLHRDQLRKVDQAEKKLQALKEQRAVVFEEATFLSKEADRLGLLSFGLEGRRAEKAENALKRSKDKNKEP
jgi:hypothetical protein